jgi:phosphoribosyl 1,2-cyclic phosphate phosphodiesterase
MRVTILGCGGASGTPAVEFGWSQCDPENPRNRRLRPSILVEDGDTKILVDTSPDLRQQALNVGVRDLDAVVFTHYHADHIHGIDDLRPFNRMMNRALDAYADAETMAVIAERFGFVFEPLAEGATMYYKPTLNPHVVSAGDTFKVNGLEVITFEQDHGFCKTLGLRFGPIAYSTDAVEIADYAFDLLDGVHTWIIGTLTDRPHPTHAHVDKALGWIDRVKPKRAVLTHLSGRMDYAKLAARLPDGVEPAYDGLVLEADDG